MNKGVAQKVERLTTVYKNYFITYSANLGKFLILTKKPFTTIWWDNYQAMIQFSHDQFEFAELTGTGLLIVQKIGHQPILEFNNVHDFVSVKRSTYGDMLRLRLPLTQDTWAIRFKNFEPNQLESRYNLETKEVEINLSLPLGALNITTYQLQEPYLDLVGPSSPGHIMGTIMVLPQGENRYYSGWISIPEVSKH